MKVSYTTYLDLGGMGLSTEKEYKMDEQILFLGFVRNIVINDTSYRTIYDGTIPYQDGFIRLKAGITPADIIEQAAEIERVAKIETTEIINGIVADKQYYIYDSDDYWMGRRTSPLPSFMQDGVYGKYQIFRLPSRHDIYLIINLVNIPTEIDGRCYAGIIIGKGGQKIKEISKSLGRQIKVIGNRDKK